MTPAEQEERLKNRKKGIHGGGGSPMGRPTASHVANPPHPLTPIPEEDEEEDIMANTEWEKAHEECPFFSSTWEKIELPPTWNKQNSRVYIPALRLALLV